MFIRYAFTIITCFTLTGCHIGRFVIYNFANQSDYKIFPNRTIKSPDKKFFFKNCSNPTKVDKIISQFGDSTVTEFEKKLQNSKTAALIIIHKDSIIYEWYDKKKDSASMMTSFSMAKSFTSILVGIAIDEGKIKSINEPITNYIDDFKNSGFDKITIKDVLKMQTGIAYKEDYYNPFGNVALAYYGTNLDKHLRKIHIAEDPGKSFDYISIASQILSVIVSKATGRTLSKYMEEKVWQKLGMEYDASWSLDHKNGREKAFCCLNARARDYAKLGRLYLHMGNWNGEQVVSSKWVKASTQYDPDDGNRTYGLHWWLDTPLYGNNKEINYFALGHLGQYLYICPKKEMVMVRIGYNYGPISWQSKFEQIARAIN